MITSFQLSISNYQLALSGQCSMANVQLLKIEKCKLKNELTEGGV